MSLLSTVVKPVHPRGLPLHRRLRGGDAAAVLVSDLLGAAGLVLTVWCYYFFRDPPRVTPARDGLVVSPADGVVSMIAPAVPPAELGLGAEPRTRVSVFMNVFDCHVNRAPVGGRVARVAYHPGKFLNASLDKASEDNERNGVVIELADGRSARGGADRRAGRAAHRLLRRRGGERSGPASASG